MELSGPVCFVSHLGAAELTAIFVFVTVGEDQEQELPDRHGTAALGAIKLGGLQVLKIGLGLAGSLLI